MCGLASLRLRGPSLGPDTPGQGAHFYSSGATFMPLERGRPAAGWTDRPRAAPGLSRAAFPASRDSWGSLKVGNQILFLDSAAFTHRRHLWVSPLGWLLVFPWRLLCCEAASGPGGPRQGWTSTETGIRPQRSERRGL